MNLILFNCAYFFAASCPKAEGFHLSQLVSVNNESKHPSWREITNSKFAFNLFENVIEAWSAIYKEKEFFKDAFKNVFEAFSGIERLMFKVKANKVVNILSAKLSSFCAILRSTDTIGMSKTDIVAFCNKNIVIDVTSVVLSALTDNSNEIPKKKRKGDNDNVKKKKLKLFAVSGAGWSAKNTPATGKSSEMCLSQLRFNLGLTSDKCKSGSNCPFLHSFVPNPCSQGEKDKMITLVESRVKSASFKQKMIASIRGLP